MFKKIIIPILVSILIIVLVFFVTKQVKQTPQTSKIKIVSSKKNKNDENNKSSLEIKTTTEDYTYEYNKDDKRTDEVLELKKYQDKIDKYSTIKTDEVELEMTETEVKEIKEKINKAFSSFPKIERNSSISPEAMKIYDVLEKYFGTKESKLGDISYLITRFNVIPYNINLQKNNDTSVSVELLLINEKNKEQYAYVTGYYELKTDIFNVTYTTLLRDGQILMNKHFTENPYS